MKKTIALLISNFLKFFLHLRYRKKVLIGKNVILNHKFIFHGSGKLIIGDDANLWAHKEPNEFLTFSPEAIIEIGAKSRINGAIFQSKKSITIGQECLIGSCHLMDTDFHSVYADKRNNPDFIKSKPIVIGDRVWLGGQSAVLKGVTIGNEAVIAFRAVVTKDVPEKCVVAGNPAVLVKSIESV